MAEVIWYLKGIKQEDIEKIPEKTIRYLNENASKEYKCEFDYNKPLKDLKLLDETRGIIGLLCYKYWCVTEEQKKNYLKKLSENERKYQKELEQKYALNYVSGDDNNDAVENKQANKTMVEYEEPIIKRIINKIKGLFVKNKKK